MFRLERRQQYMKQPLFVITSLSILVLASCSLTPQRGSVESNGSSIDSSVESSDIFSEAPVKKEITLSEAKAKAQEIADKAEDENFKIPQDYKVEVKQDHSVYGLSEHLEEVYLTHKFFHSSFQSTALDGTTTASEAYFFLKDGNYHSIEIENEEVTSSITPEESAEGAFESAVKSYDPNTVIPMHMGDGVDFLSSADEIVTSNDLENFSYSFHYFSLGEGSLILEGTMRGDDASRGTLESTICLEFSDFLMRNMTTNSSMDGYELTETISFTYNASGLAYPELA